MIEVKDGKIIVDNNVVGTVHEYVESTKIVRLGV